MKKPPQTSKHSLDPTQSETTVAQFCHSTESLSAPVDGLAADFVAQEITSRKEKQQLYDKASDAWNQFEDTYGAFTDENSTL